MSPVGTSVPEAEVGAIIPVNALPGNDAFTVWWYKEIAPPSEEFESLFVPSIVGRYGIVWPGEEDTADVTEIVIAANEGTGDLPVSQLDATVYRRTIQTIRATIPTKSTP